MSPETRSSATLGASAVLLLLCPMAVFAGCQIRPNAMGFVSIPKTTAEIKDYAFANCTALKTIHIPNSVKRERACPCNPTHHPASDALFSSAVRPLPFPSPPRPPTAGG